MKDYQEQKVVAEVPQYDCWTTQLNRDIYAYGKHPHTKGGERQSFWQAHPEHWRYRDLEDLVCDRKVVRMNDLCDSCHRRVLAWERDYHAAKKRQRKGDQ